jgi:hypothetical protein
MFKSLASTRIEISLSHISKLYIFLDIDGKLRMLSSCHLSQFKKVGILLIVLFILAQTDTYTDQVLVDIVFQHPVAGDVADVLIHSWLQDVVQQFQDE